MNVLNSRIRPAGESSDEDEFANYMSDEDNIPLSRVQSTVNTKELENERTFQLFLNSNTDEVISLLDGGFDVNQRLRDNWTPLLLAASVGAPDVTAELISRGADVNMHRDYYTPLMAAASCPKSTSPYESSLVVVHQLLKNNADVNAKTRKRVNALMFAASNGNCSVIKELLPHCDKMAEDNQGWTALFWAVSGNCVEAVQLLLEEELPADKFDVRGNLPMHYAKESGLNDIIDILPWIKQEEDDDFIYTEYGYQDFLDTGRSDFPHDVAVMLYGMNSEKYFKNFLNNEINLFKLLTITDDDLKNIQIKMPYERYQILNCLYRFHKHPFRTKALPIVGKFEPYSTINVANTVLSACRQFIVMQASLRYISKNMTEFGDLKDLNTDIEKIKESLVRIKDVVNQINFKAIERASNALSVSLRSVDAVIKEVKDKGTPHSPKKMKLRGKPVRDIDDFDKVAIKNIMYEMCAEKKHITLQNFLEKLSERNIYIGFDREEMEPFIISVGDSSSSGDDSDSNISL